MEQGAFIFGEVPNASFVVESKEYFGVVDSSFNILEYFVCVSVNFLIFVVIFR
jgi:hypothetical protein